MSLKLPGFVLVLFLLLPSAAYLWSSDDIPQFGDPHDDGLYYVSARSLANGTGYTIESLPGAPAQTKYPPLYPLLLSLAWRINPHFPGNLPLAAWLSWLALPAILFQLKAYYPRMGVAGGRAALLMALLAVNPYVIWIGSHLHSELFFLALALGAMLLIERAAEAPAGPPVEALGWAVAAGAVAGLAYLARSAGIVMLFSAPVYLMLRHARRQAWCFAGAMLPFVGGWMLWAHFHQLKTSDPALQYYTSYVAYELQNVSLTNLPVLLWKNLDELLKGLGSLIIPKVTGSLPEKLISEALAVAMIVGVVRMVRSGRGLHYALFGAGSVFLLLIWHFPPNERFVLPLFPLALAGLLVEMERLGGGLRKGLIHKDAGQRIAALVIVVVGVVLFGGGLALQVYLDAFAMPAGNREERLSVADGRVAFNWIRANIPMDSTLFANEDPVVFLSTGHHALSRPIPPSLWYREDHAGTVDLFKSVVAYAREHGIEHVYFARCYARQTISEEDSIAMEHAIRSNPDLIRIFSQGAATVYRIRPQSPYAGAPRRVAAQ